jgi:hypothetical protein
VACALLAAALVAVAGCGGDDEKLTTTETGAPPADTGTTDTATTDTATTETESTGTESERTETEGSGGASPEDGEGGAGDEEAARSEAVFTGKGGKLTPRIVRVPPFIAVRVVLRSADGGRYKLEIGGRELEAEGGSATADLDGLRPGDEYTGRAEPSGTVRVEASAEPGP